jgi:hypothetical protein
VQVAAQVLVLTRSFFCRAVNGLLPLLVGAAGAGTGVASPVAPSIGAGAGVGAGVGGGVEGGWCDEVSSSIVRLGVPVVCVAAASAVVVHVTPGVAAAHSPTPPPSTPVFAPVPPPPLSTLHVPLQSLTPLLDAESTSIICVTIATAAPTS